MDSYIQNSRMESQCTLLRIRAGIFLKEDCLSTLNSYLKLHNNVKLIIHALPHDFLPVKDFVTALNAVGKESVLLDLPQVALEKIRTLSGFPAIPNTNRWEVGPIFNVMIHCIFFSVKSLFVCFFSQDLQWTSKWWTTTERKRSFYYCHHYLCQSDFHSFTFSIF